MLSLALVILDHATMSPIRLAHHHVVGADVDLFHQSWDVASNAHHQAKADCRKRPQHVISNRGRNVITIQCSAAPGHLSGRKLRTLG